MLQQGMWKTIMYINLTLRLFSSVSLLTLHNSTYDGTQESLPLTHTFPKHPYFNLPCITVWKDTLEINLFSGRHSSMVVYLVCNRDA